MSSSRLLALLGLISKFVDIFYKSQYHQFAIFIIILLTYLIGHAVKVLAIIQYEIAVAIFDKSINKIFALIVSIIYFLINWIYGLLSSSRARL